MFRKLNAKLLAGAMLLGVAAMLPSSQSATAQPQVTVQIGFNEFYAALSPYGRWFHHPRWGDVWQPRVNAGFRPYVDGHWDYTDPYGWVWVSGYVWGDIPFHYGRWVYDPDSGWLWIPGYVWAPAWVLWRSGGGYVGWFPMPPDNAFLAGDEVYPTAWSDADRAYGYMDWYGANYGPNWFATDWQFVPSAHFADSDYSRYAVGRNDAVRLYRNSRDVTHFTTTNDYVVNRSIDAGTIAAARHRAVTPVPLRDALRAAPIAAVTVGRQVQQTEHRQHGGNPREAATARAAPLAAPAPAPAQRQLAGPPGREQRANQGPQTPGFTQTPPQGFAEAPRGRPERGAAPQQAPAPQGFAQGSRGRPERGAAPQATAPQGFAQAPQGRPERGAAPQQAPAAQGFAQGSRGRPERGAAPQQAPAQQGFAQAPQGRPERGVAPQQAPAPQGFAQAPQGRPERGAAPQPSAPQGFAQAPQGRPERGFERAPFAGAPPAAVPQAAPAPQQLANGGHRGGPQGGPPPQAAPAQGGPPAGGPQGHGGQPPAQPPAAQGGPPPGNQHGRGHEHG